MVKEPVCATGVVAMRTVVRPLLVICLVLLVPIVPFLLLGGVLEGWFAAWAEHPKSELIVAAVVAGLLTTDILLPVPSSLVSTFGGGALGVWWGTLVSWLGMNVGAAIGFALARWFGPPVSRWLSSPGDVQRLKNASDRYGPLALILARGVPVFAEASILLLGIHGLSWKRFLPALLASNLGIALAYSVFGTYAAQHAWLPLAMGVSIALPLLLTTLARWWLAAAIGAVDE